MAVKAKTLAVVARVLVGQGSTVPLTDLFEIQQQKWTGAMLIHRNFFSTQIPHLTLSDFIACSSTPLFNEIMRFFLRIKVRFLG